MYTLDRTWHLAENEADAKITEFEFQLWRVFYGFLQWQEECEKNVNGTELTGNDLAILHIIRMQEKAKTSNDVGRLLNRHDTFNIKYSIQKLLKLGLIEKIKIQQEVKKIYYQVSEAGRENTDNYTYMRKLVLIELFNQAPDLNLEIVIKCMGKIKSIYDEADRVIASYSTPQKTKKIAITKNNLPTINVSTLETP